MATSSQPLVLSLFYKLVCGIEVELDGADTLYVFDGEPTAASLPANFVAAMALPQDETGGTIAWRTIGGLGRTETYDLGVHIFCFAGGTQQPNTVAGPQATALANCQAIEAAIETAWKDDPTLAVTNGGTAPVVWTLLSGVSFKQTPPDQVEQPGMGRYATCDLRFSVFNVLYG